jgi:hypothetical protein
MSRGENVSRVVRIDRGAPAPAYSPASLQQIVNTGEGPRPQPLCEVPANSLFVIGDQEMLLAPYYQFAPVRCGDEPAWVPWDLTLLDATIRPGPDGSWQLSQVTGAMCDAPSFTVWMYGPNGRGAILSDERGLAGCGD